MVGGNLLVLFVQAIGPVDIEIHRIESTQAEMQAGIAARVKAGLAEHGLGLRLTPIMGHDTRLRGALPTKVLEVYISECLVDNGLLPLLSSSASHVAVIVAVRCRTQPTLQAFEGILLCAQDFVSDWLSVTS